MSFCSNCGTQFRSDDKYCINCGTHINTAPAAPHIDQKDNELQKNVTTPNHDKVNSSKARNSGSAGDSSKRKNQISTMNRRGAEPLYSIILGIAIKPVINIKRLVKYSNTSLVVMLTIGMAIFQGLLGLWKVQQWYRQLGDGIKAFANQILSYAALISGTELRTSDLNSFVDTMTKIQKSMNIPYDKIFMQNLLLLLCYVCLYFICIFVVGNGIFKSNATSFNIYKISLFSTLPLLYGETLGIMLSYISSQIGITIFILGAAITLGTQFICFKDELRINSDKIVFTVSIAFVVCLIILLLLFFSFIRSDLTSISGDIWNTLLKEILK